MDHKQDNAMSEDIRQMCQSLPLRDKVELREYLTDLITESKLMAQRSPERCGELFIVMADVLDVAQISYISRIPMYVWARTMVAYQMMREGYSLTEIARQMGKTHATVLHMRNKMMDVLHVPEAYRDILPLWDKFSKRMIDDIHN